MKLLTTMIMMLVCLVMSFLAVLDGEIFHSVELFSIGILLLSSLESHR